MKRQSPKVGDAIAAIAAIAVVAVSVSWVIALAAGRVPIALLGDESGRLLISFDASSPSGFVKTVFSGAAWTDIHPPGDALSKGIINMALGPFVSDVGTLIRIHQLLAAVSVAGGLAAISLGIRHRWGTGPAVAFAALAAAASPVTYVAHHVIAEAPTILVIGLAVRSLLRTSEFTVRSTAPTAVLLFIAAIIRPEAAAVFSSIAILPVLQRAWASAISIVGAAAAPIVLTTAAIELTGDGESYASIRRFAPEGFFSVVVNEQMRTIIWGFGLSAFFSVAMVVLLVVRFAAWGRGTRSWEGAALSGSWLFWAAVFTWQISVGAVHRQERAYVFVALLGLVALAAVLHELRESGYTFPTTAMLGLGLVFMGSAVWATWSQTHESWQAAYPPQSEQLANFFVANTDAEDSVLFGWMWWEEWRVGLHATSPSAPDSYCLYYRCRSGESRSAEDLIDVTGLDAQTARRRVEAASFLLDVQPRHIVMFTDERQDAWDRWPGSFPTFVRQLLDTDGTCYISVVNSDRYCPVLENDFYMVLERS